MTPKEFSDLYPPGTKVHFDLEKYDLNNTISWPNGILTYLGLAECDQQPECNGDCDGMLKLKQTNGNVMTDCMCFNTDDLRGEIPLGDMGVIPDIIRDDDFEI